MPSLTSLKPQLHPSFIPVSAERRDLKSNNIMLTGEGVAKIGDVGLAWVRSQGDPNYEFAHAVSCYAAPEAVLGDECTEKVRYADEWSGIIR